MAPRASVCSDTVVSAPATTPTATHPAILSLWPIRIPLTLRKTRHILKKPRTRYGLAQSLHFGSETGGPARFLAGLYSLLRLALRRSRRRCVRRRIGIAQIVVADRAEVGGELVSQWNGVGNVQPDDVGLGDALETLHTGADRLDVSHKYHAIARNDG